uniref:Uncharacterized protein n=1 Tax=Takifugu rubripes TaxID=31033 RepID=A0A674NXJ7_TAKRU
KRATATKALFLCTQRASNTSGNTTLSFTVETDLLSAGEPVGQLLQAAHHSLIPEVVREVKSKPSPSDPPFISREY